MDHEEIIEKLYDISAVEGVAWFSSAGNLTENQLSISEAAVEEIGKALYEMRSSLSAAERLLKGLLLKTEKRAFLCFLQGDLLVLLELDSEAEVDGVYSTMRSLIGSVKPAQASAPAPEPQVVDQAAEVKESPEPEAAVEGLISKSDFEKALLTSFKQVSTMQLAKKLIAESMSANGISADVEGITLEQASAVALITSEKIPNKARRAIIKKELKSILQRFQSS